MATITAVTRGPRNATRAMTSAHASPAPASQQIILVLTAVAVSLGYGATVIPPIPRNPDRFRLVSPTLG